MDKKTIGILGATGYVGQEAVRTLLAFTGHNIVLGGRNITKICQLFPETTAKGDCFQVDIYDRQMLHRFCGNCDIVVNCAGPANKISDTIAQAAIEQRVHYVDASGGEVLLQQLRRREQEIVKNNLLFVVASGVYPGLSELFPAYIAEKYFDDMDSLELFFAGQGAFSLNAAYDIVCGIEADSGSGMTCYQHGAVKRISGNFHTSYTLPYPAGQLDTYPVISREFEQMAKCYPIQSARFYNTYANKAAFHTLVMIKAMKQYKTEEQKKASAKKLAEQFDIRRKAIDDFTMFHLIAAGNKSGRRVRLAANLLYRSDWNALSGKVAANVARMIIEGKQEKSGCFFAAEGVEAAKVVEALTEQNIELKLH
ncbi:saccharopine dehydrogenase NADP-binding domain-containing protein|uniref:Saccharopine dehydrogenase NADP binding domain-containing protein n=1 Tax=Dendrosporobacter quercicolus TaxID=146817 RepID=A0A1G9RRU4_9FIRM|nr:saccharopine dehydrogenase NADP-binding domain-containing protein [Dendrosporobacter quercicolus]NSL49369.1 saccharopine dehydrogenase NADP-binding domain-containing protein [Dendrosporobacter quercicolus DSM 1736]SDM25926.1 Saccharopine dehydrogenase NADP binding domain-containing protein [Dendrosporobacter quercicolus]